MATAPNLVPVLPPRCWWTRSQYTPFSPLFDSRAAALNYYKNDQLMKVCEQSDACTAEG